ncbi:hypothetical protein EV360DRAFT_85515 [Lentinula raphanica]|nr:hypothetical protein EV360DRAFT_85515 [Lentinula raphanica]
MSFSSKVVSNLSRRLDDRGSTIPGHLIYKYPILTVELPVSSSPSYISPSETAGTSLITSSASVQTTPTSIPTSTSVPNFLSLSSTSSVQSSSLVPATKLSVDSVTRDPETISLTSKPIPQTSSFTKTETKIIPSTTFIKVPEPVGVIASNGPTSSAMASATHEPSRELSSSFMGSGTTSTQSSGSLVPPSSSPVASNYEYSHTTSHALAITGLIIGIFSVVLVVIILAWKHYQRRRRRRREEESTWDGHASMQQLHGSPLHAFPLFDESFGASWQRLKHRFFRREKILQESDLSQVSVVAVVSSDSSDTSQLRRQTVPDDIHTTGSAGPASILPVSPVVARSNLARALLPVVQEHGERLSVPAFRHQDSGWREPMVNRPTENQGEIDEGKVEMPLIELPPNYTTS